MLEFAKEFLAQYKRRVNVGKAKLYPREMRRLQNVIKDLEGVNG